MWCGIGAALVKMHRTSRQAETPSVHKSGSPYTPHTLQPAVLAVYSTGLSFPHLLLSISLVHVKWVDGFCSSEKRVQNGPVQYTLLCIHCFVVNRSFHASFAHYTSQDQENVHTLYLRSLSSQTCLPPTRNFTGPLKLGSYSNYVASSYFSPPLFTLHDTH
jgi:hypothetical protein